MTERPGATTALAAAAAGAAVVVFEVWLLIGGPFWPAALAGGIAAAAAVTVIAGIARCLAPRARPAWYATTGRVARISPVLGAVYVLTILVLVGRPSADERPTATAGILAAVGVVIGCAAISTRPAGGRTRQRGFDEVDAVTQRMARAVPVDESIQQIVDVLRRAEGRRSVEIWQRRGADLMLTHAAPLRDAAPVVFDERTAGAATRAGVIGSGWLRTWLPALLDEGDDGPTCAGTAAPSELTRVAPLASHGEVLGLVVLRRAARDAPFDPVDDEALTRVQHPLAAALRHARLDAELEATIDELRARNTELQRSRARLVSVADAERRRLERDLHDGAQSHLTALEVKLQLAKAMADRTPERAGELIGALEDDVAGAVKELRSLSHGIVPNLLLTGGLRDALAGAASRAQVPVTVDDIAATRFRPEVEAAVYFCCLEALQNVAKHAGRGAAARVTVSSDEHSLRFVVADDGVGITGTDPHRRVSGRGQGLLNMADRIGALSGSVTLRSGPDGGAEVIGQVPLAPDVGSAWSGAGPASAK